MRDAEADAARHLALKEREHARELEEQLELAASQGKASQAQSVRECEERMEKEMAAALEQLQSESEALVGKLEAAIGVLRREKEEADVELSNTKAALEEHDDTIYDLRNTLKRRQREHALAMLNAAVAARGAQETTAKARRDERANFEQTLTKVKRELAETEERYRAQVAELERGLDESDEWRTQMHETLVNHKREALIAHKTMSASLATELDALGGEREAIDAKKELLLEQISEMEESVHALEEQIHSHSKESAIQDGRVNIARAKKKRRLDDEYEQLLEAIEAKRSAVSALDTSMQKLVDERQEKEDQMKALERQLVELLVEQQKKLLAILTAASNSTSGASRKRRQKTPE